MNRKELIDSILRDYPEFSNWSHHLAEEVLCCTINEIKKSLQSSNDVALVGFGTFTKIKRSARKGINPSTGEAMQIKERVVPIFRASQAFKDYL
ncbi:MAG: HU family DNA-binding protein [Oligoflexia bacterium]|nr:HU family DNA-binding protein [Oligoflexia bacterium]MBF0365274.1 HU family DNA-binding protein [Oligoflexia bacterium]